MFDCAATLRGTKHRFLYHQSIYNLNFNYVSYTQYVEWSYGYHAVKLRPTKFSGYVSRIIDSFVWLSSITMIAMNKTRWHTRNTCVTVSCFFFPFVYSIFPLFIATIFLFCFILFCFSEWASLQLVSITLSCYCSFQNCEMNKGIDRLKLLLIRAWKSGQMYVGNEFETFTANSFRLLTEPIYERLQDRSFCRQSNPFFCEYNARLLWFKLALFDFVFKPTL